MMETVAGRYDAVTLISYQDREDLHSETGYNSDDMDGLSDSQSTRASHSRPTTPSDPSSHPIHLVTLKPTTSRSRSFSAESDLASPHFALPAKATHILGLVPGTLPHAMACLENARDEARRLSDLAPYSSVPPPTYTVDVAPATQTKKGGGRMDRARKAMSIAMPSAGTLGRMGSMQGPVPTVVMTLSGEEENAKMDWRRKVADGVLHWQKEVQRLRDVEETDTRSGEKDKQVGRMGTMKGRR